jgi:galactokinase
VTIRAEAPGPERSGFQRVFGYPPVVVARAPGRVNLIGEFTDYNDGWVLPFALDRATVVSVAGRTDGTVAVTTSMLSPGDPDRTVRVPVATLAPGVLSGWAAYAVGVVWAMRAAGLAVDGFDMHIDTDVPIGAGLSSSAALECAVAVALDALFATGCSADELARLARHAENDFVGVPSGIMDQTASLRGEAGNALLLDTRSLEVRQIPFDPAASGLQLLVVDTQVHHDLGSSAYAERRRTCLDAAAALRVPALRDVPYAGLDAALARLPDDVARRRVRHIVSEDRRVLTVADLLTVGDLRGVGPLLTETHGSLRDDFEVSCPELDLAVGASIDAGALGARMIGGGFGGSAIALVDTVGAPALAAAVADAFGRAGFRPPSIFPAAPAAGAGLVV